MKVDENGNIVDSATVASMEELQEFISDVEIPEIPSDDTKNVEVTPVLETVEKKPEGGEPTKVEESGDEVPVVTPIVPVVETAEVVDPKDAQIAALTELVNQLSGSKVKDETHKESPAVVTPPNTTEVTPLDTLLESVDFDSIMESKQEFIKFFKSAMAVVKEDAVQRTLTSMPQVVGTFVQRHASLRDVAKNFYSEHPELLPVKKYVTHVANEISAEHGDWDIVKVLTETAVRVKESLKLKSVVQTTDRAALSKPTLPGGSQGAKGTRKPSTGLQSEIDDLIND